MKDTKRKPGVGVAVIVRKDNKVLLGKRKSSHGAGTWHFPGGKLDFYEELEDCAKREVEEETGIKIKNIKFVTITNDMFKSEDLHYVTIFMVCDHESGEPTIKEPEKCKVWGWFEWNKLPKPLFLPIINLQKQNYNPFTNRKLFLK